MTKGYKYLTAGAGMMLIAGFALPWLCQSPFYFSGFSFAMPGYLFLHTLPLSGAAAIFFVFLSR